MDILQFVECLFQRFWNSILLATGKATAPAPPVEVSLNKNISTMEKAILKGYKKNESSV